MFIFGSGSDGLRKNFMQPFITAFPYFREEFPIGPFQHPSAYDLASALINQSICQSVSIEIYQYMHVNMFCMHVYLMRTCI